MDQKTHVMHEGGQRQQGNRGGILRSLLRPFMPEVSAGIDIASGLLHGDPSQALGAASKAIAEEMTGEEAPPEDPPMDDKVQPGNPDEALAMDAAPPASGGGAEGGMGMAGGGGGGAEEMNPNEPEPDGDQDDFTPEQMQSLNFIAQQFPTWNTELQKDPSLLDGAGNLIKKLGNYYKRQQPQPTQQGMA